MTTADFMDRRAHPRINRAVPIRCKELYGDSYLDKSTRAYDLSIGGLRFECDSFVSLARRILVELDLRSDGDPLRAMFKVVWIRKGADDELFEIGGQFVAMTGEDEAVLSDYVNEILKNDYINRW